MAVRSHSAAKLTSASAGLRCGTAFGMATKTFVGLKALQGGHRVPCVLRVGGVGMAAHCTSRPWFVHMRHSSAHPCLLRRSVSQRSTRFPAVAMGPCGTRCGFVSTSSASVASSDSVPKPGAAVQPLLFELWEQRSRAGHSQKNVAPQLVVPSSAVFRRHVDSVHHWDMIRIFGDRMSSTPPSGAHVFYSCGVIESIFLFVNAFTLSPFIFEMAMPYHLKYTGLVAAWWGGTYWGLNVARYGPLSNTSWFAARAAAGVALVLLGTSSLALADGVGKLGPWPSYCVLIGSFSGMAMFDMALDKKQMIPPWLLKWKIGLSGLIVASLLLGLLKGYYLEKNAARLVMEEAAAVSDF